MVFGSAVTDTGSGEVTAAIAAQSIAGTAHVKNATRIGMRRFGGCHFNDLLAAVAKVPINERYAALARVGVWHWKAEYRLAVRTMA